MKTVLMSTLRGILAAAVAIFILLLIFSFISVKSEDPDKMLTLFSYITLCIGTLVGGFVSAKGSESRLVSGVMTGICVMLIIFLFSLVFASRTGTSALRMLLTVIFPVLGAFMRRGENGNRVSARTRRNIGKKYGAYR